MTEKKLRQIASYQTRKDEFDALDASPKLVRGKLKKESSLKSKNSITNSLSKKGSEEYDEKTLKKRMSKTRKISFAEDQFSAVRSLLCFKIKPILHYHYIASKS